MFTQKLFLKSFGCKSNFAELFNSFIDLDEINCSITQIKKLSELADTQSNAILVVNTCVVTKAAERECGTFIKRAVSRYTHINIYVTGCMTNEPQLRAELEAIKSDRLTVVDTQTLVRNLKSYLTSTTSPEVGAKIGPGFMAHTRGFLKIQDGCKCFCNYCIVPYVRPWSSLDYSMILSRFKRMLDKGYKEIVLTGINIGNYGKAPGAGRSTNLWMLISELLAIAEGRARIRISSIEPEDVGEELLSLLDRHNHLCPHLHLPLQSGSNKVLQDMNRRCTREKYIEVVKHIRTDSNRVISADLLIGYPTETISDFAETISLIYELGLERVHIFSYSPRPNTPAARLPQIQQKELKHRKERIFSAAREATAEHWRRFIGSNIQVLAEEKHENYVSGLGAGYQLVKLPINSVVGEMYQVLLEGYANEWFIGKVVS